MLTLAFMPPIFPLSVTMTSQQSLSSVALARPSFNKSYLTYSKRTRSVAHGINDNTSCHVLVDLVESDLDFNSFLSARSAMDLLTSQTSGLPAKISGRPA